MHKEEETSFKKDPNGGRSRACQKTNSNKNKKMNHQ